MFKKIPEISPNPHPDILLDPQTNSSMTVISILTKIPKRVLYRLDYTGNNFKLVENCNSLQSCPLVSVLGKTPYSAGLLISKSVTESLKDACWLWALEESSLAESSHQTRGKKTNEHISRNVKLFPSTNDFSCTVGVVVVFGGEVSIRSFLDALGCFCTSNHCFLSLNVDCNTKCYQW